MTPHTSFGSSPEQTLCHPRSYPWCVLFDSTSPFFLYFSFLSFSVYFLHNELFLELDNPIVMESLCYSAAEKSEGTLNASHSFTGYEPNVLTFGELNDSSVPFSFMIPSSDQDVDDASGVELVSRANYTSRKKRNRETCWRQSKALKRVQREAKRELVAQPEISYEAAEASLRSQAPRSDEKIPGIIHVSHRLALLHGHENVIFLYTMRCCQRWVDHSSHLSQHVRLASTHARVCFSLAGGIRQNRRTETSVASAHFERAQFFSLTLLDALTHRAISTLLVIKKKKSCGHGKGWKGLGKDFTPSVFTSIIFRA